MVHRWSSKYVRSELALTKFLPSSPQKVAGTEGKAEWDACRFFDANYSTLPVDFDAAFEQSRRPLGSLKECVSWDYDTTVDMTETAVTQVNIKGFRTRSWSWRRLLSAHETYRLHTRSWNWS